MMAQLEGVFSRFALPSVMRARHAAAIVTCASAARSLPAFQHHLLQIFISYIVSSAQGMLS